MWGVYPEARDWNVGAMCLDFSLGVRPTHLNLAIFLTESNLSPFWGFSPDMLPQIKNLSTQHQTFASG